MNDSKQVSTEHYDFQNYVDAARWNSYWHQVNEIVQLNPLNAIIVGSGDNIVPGIVKALGVDAKTFDFDKELKPDFVGDVRDIGVIVSPNSFDVVLCSQVLEHVPYEYFHKALKGLFSIARKKVIISLPYSHLTFLSVSIRFPKTKRFYYDFILPRFWKKWKFNGEHYWEVGTKEYPISKIEKAILDAGGMITKNYFANNNKYHLFYVIDVDNYRQESHKE